MKLYRVIGRSMLEMLRGRHKSSCLACNMCIMRIATAASTSSKGRAEGSVDEAPLNFPRPFVLAPPLSHAAILAVPLLIGCGMLAVGSRMRWCSCRCPSGVAQDGKSRAPSRAAQPRASRSRALARDSRGPHGRLANAQGSALGDRRSQRRASGLSRGPGACTRVTDCVKGDCRDKAVPDTSSRYPCRMSSLPDRP